MCIRDRPLDASILNKPVQLRIQAKKFFCLNPNCKRQIFTERFTGFLNAYRRLTIRLEEVICTLCQGQRKKPKQLEADFCILQESAFLNSIDI